MSAPMFDFIVAQGPEGSTIYLGGEIDFAATLELAPRIEEIVATCNGDLLLDLAGVTFIDSEGIKMLLKAFELAHHASLTARMVAVSGRARHVMEMAGVADLFMLSGAAPAGHKLFSWRVPGPEASQRS